MIAMFAAALVAPMPADGRCHETHIHADGHVTERMVDDPGTPGAASASASGTGRSSVSVSAASSSQGGATSSATSDDGARRTTVKREEGRCTITIDERPQP